MNSMQSNKGSNTQEDDLKRKPGLWIGVDLGTTNSTAAYYNRNTSEAKLIRFKSPFSKDGKILPSTLAYKEGTLIAVGQEGIDLLKSQSDDIVLLSSVKRIWGMDATQVDKELQIDDTFLESCPFKTVIMKSKDDNDKGRVEIAVAQDEKHGLVSVSPMQVVHELLSTIREEANAYFQKEKSERAVGRTDINPSDLTVRHCIITVPAHFSLKRRENIIEAARNAGFDGYVGVLVESTAATISYGLFVGRTTKKTILVFDMGGGTTDITIAEMIPNHDLDKTNMDHTNVQENFDDCSFRVIGTGGNPRLGGDDMDILLCNYIQRKLYNDNWKVQQEDDTDLKSMTVQNQLRMSCKEVKEELCGGNNEYDEELIYPASVQVPIPPSLSKLSAQSSKIIITQEDFHDVISPVVTKASQLIEKTLQQCHLSADHIDEVILVGGATKTPSIRKMLQQQFTKSVELCTSIDPYSTVAQGAAIYGAIVSDLVPKYELKNALMLDALPHPIGVLTVDEKGEEDYVPILERGMELPAMNCATFQLKDVYQKGVTIIAVEDVGDEFPLERVGSGDGTFTFLLHRLSDEKLKEMAKSGQGRYIEVGMTVETSGRFIVSIFDENDPEHLEKKKRYQEWKKNHAEDGDDNVVHALGPMTNIKCDKLGTEEVLLIIGCMILFLLYVGIKMILVEHIADVHEL